MGKLFNETNPFPDYVFDVPAVPFAVEFQPLKSHSNLYDVWELPDGTLTCAACGTVCRTQTVPGRRTFCQGARRSPWDALDDDTREAVRRRREELWQEGASLLRSAPTTTTPRARAPWEKPTPRDFSAMHPTAPTPFSATKNFILEPSRCTDHRCR